MSSAEAGGPVIGASRLGASGLGASGLAGAVVIPAAPALLPGLGGTADPLGPLRDTLTAAVETQLGVTASQAPLLVVGDVGAETEPGEFGWEAPSGIRRFTDGGVEPGALPTSLDIARDALRRCGVAPGRREIRMVGVADTRREVLADLGSVAARSGALLIVVADGPASLTEKAPGYLHAHAARVADEVERAVGGGDPEALAGLDRERAREVWMRGWAPLQVLAIAAGGRRWLAEDVAVQAPFGVQYLLARWTPA